jgi:hypothetical protein
MSAPPEGRERRESRENRYVLTDISVITVVVF